MTERSTLVFQLGDMVGVAIATNVVPYHNADLTFYMFDKKLKGRAPIFKELIKWLFSTLKLRRVTMTFTIFEPLVVICERMGFKREGFIRESGYMNKGIVIYGILASEL